MNFIKFPLYRLFMDAILVILYNIKKYIYFIKFPLSRSFMDAILVILNNIKIYIILI